MTEIKLWIKDLHYSLIIGKSHLVALVEFSPLYIYFLIFLRPLRCDGAPLSGIVGMTSDGSMTKTINLTDDGSMT